MNTLPGLAAVKAVDGERSVVVLEEFARNAVDRPGSSQAARGGMMPIIRASCIAATGAGRLGALMEGEAQHPFESIDKCPDLGRHQPCRGIDRPDRQRFGFRILEPDFV